MFRTVLRVCPRNIRISLSMSIDMMVAFTSSKLCIWSSMTSANDTQSTEQTNRGGQKTYRLTVFVRNVLWCSHYLIFDAKTSTNTDNYAKSNAREMSANIHTHSMPHHNSKTHLASNIEMYAHKHIKRNESEKVFKLTKINLNWN